jgi:hypothetical protein
MIRIAGLILVFLVTSSEFSFAWIDNNHCAGLMGYLVKPQAVVLHKDPIEYTSATTSHRENNISGATPDEGWSHLSAIPIENLLHPTIRALDIGFRSELHPETKTRVITDISGKGVRIELQVKSDPRNVHGFILDDKVAASAANFINRGHYPLTRPAEALAESLRANPPQRNDYAQAVASAASRPWINSVVSVKEPTVRFEGRDIPESEYRRMKQARAEKERQEESQHHYANPAVTSALFGIADALDPDPPLPAQWQWLQNAFYEYKDRLHHDVYGLDQRTFFKVKIVNDGMVWFEEKRPLHKGESAPFLGAPSNRFAIPLDTAKEIVRILNTTPFEMLTRYPGSNYTIMGAGKDGGWGFRPPKMSDEDIGRPAAMFRKAREEFFHKEMNAYLSTPVGQYNYWFEKGPWGPWQQGWGDGSYVNLRDRLLGRNDYISVIAVEPNRVLIGRAGYVGSHGYTSSLQNPPRPEYWITRETADRIVKLLKEFDKSHDHSFEIEANKTLERARVDYLRQLGKLPERSPWNPSWSPPWDGVTRDP